MVCSVNDIEESSQACLRKTRLSRNLSDEEQEVSTLDGTTVQVEKTTKRKANDSKMKKY